MKDAKMNTKVVKSYSDNECNTFDVINDEGVMIAHYYEHLVNPDTKEVLQNPVFEIYYDYDSEFDEHLSSLLSEDFDDIVDIIDNL